MGLLEDKESLVQLLKLPSTASVADIKAKIDSGESRFIQIGKLVGARRLEIDRKLEEIEVKCNAARALVLEYLRKHERKQENWKELQQAAWQLGFPSPQGVTKQDLLARWKYVLVLYLVKKKKLDDEEKEIAAQEERYEEQKKRVDTVKKSYLDFFHQLKKLLGSDGKRIQLGLDEMKQLDELLKEERLKEERLASESAAMAKASPPPKQPQSSPPQKHSSLPPEQLEEEEREKGYLKIQYELGKKMSLKISNRCTIPYREATLYSNIEGKDDEKVCVMVSDNLEEVLSLQESMKAHVLQPGRYFFDEDNSRHILMFEKFVNSDNEGDDKMGHASDPKL